MMHQSAMHDVLHPPGQIVNPIGSVSEDDADLERWEDDGGREPTSMGICCSTTMITSPPKRGRNLKPFDQVSFIMAYENGECSDDQIAVGFQHLIDSGIVWQLQGAYGRMAARLIEAGECQDHRLHA